MFDDKINYIKINDYFWVQFREYLVSFSFQGIPDDIHFTIAFNQNSSDINLHITKNSENRLTKPKITIFHVSKQSLEERFTSISSTLLNSILQPLDIDALKQKYNNELGYISFEDMREKDTSGLTEQSLIQSFKEISSVKRKSRLKIKGDIGQQLEKFATSDEVIEALEDILVDIPTQYDRLVDGGVIISEEHSVTVIRIQDKWFTLISPQSPWDIFSILASPMLVKRMIIKCRWAISALRTANTYEDVKEIDIPFRLVLNQNVNQNDTI